LSRLQQNESIGRTYGARTGRQQSDKYKSFDERQARARPIIGDEQDDNNITDSVSRNGKTSPTEDESGREIEYQFAVREGNEEDDEKT
jgi:hypothetical protein